MTNPLFPNVGVAWEHARPYELEDAAFAAQHKRVVLGHKTGLGKTYIALLAWSKWYQARRGLIVGTLGSMATWRRILMEWGGVEPIFMQGTGDPNWKVAISGQKEGIWMCTYMTFLYLMKNVTKPHQVAFDVLINDELHRTMRNRRNQIVTKMGLIDNEYYIGMSATWSSRGPQDLFPVLNLIDRKRFSSYWRFCEQWCYVEKSNFGTEVFGVKNPIGLRKMLWDNYYVARRWPEVADQFMDKPYKDEPVVRQVEVLEMTPKQSELYRQMDNDMVAALDEEMIVTPNSLARLTKLLEIAISPAMVFDKGENGIALEWLKDRINEDRHTVVFSPYKKALDLLRLVLRGDGHSDDMIFTLKGGTNPDKINDIVAGWKKCKGVMLCTIDFAQSFALDTTDTAYMLGFDWDPNDNEQAEGRLRRMDSILQYPCFVRYIVIKGTVYEDVREVVNGKKFNTVQFLERRIRHQN